MKLASLSFFVLLLAAHLTDDFEIALGQALSMFRDGPRGWIGYALFASLLLVCLFYVLELTRSRRGTEAAFACLALLVLLVVALTPSTDGFHLLSSLILFVLLFFYYALLLYREEPLWLIAHLAVPIVVALVIQFYSYGLWQKCFIAYFVFLANAHHFALTLQRVEGDLLPVSSCRKRCGRLGKRRKVYRLAMDNDWARRDERTDPYRLPRPIRTLPNAFSAASAHPALPFCLASERMEGFPVSSFISEAKIRDCCAWKLRDGHVGHSCFNAPGCPILPEVRAGHRSCRVPASGSASGTAS